MRRDSAQHLQAAVVAQPGSSGVAGPNPATSGDLFSTGSGVMLTNEKAPVS